VEPNPLSESVLLNYERPYGRRSTDTWDADPHTLVKHRILKTYLDAWAPILSHAKAIDSAELLFVDGFAGPGTYATGEPGSPVVAINAILDHMHNMPRPVRFIMIENRPDRFEKLRSIIDDLKPQIAASNKLIVDDPILGRHCLSFRTGQRESGDSCVRPAEAACSE
jgi:hypothetical protein